jgi:DNA-binding transcriptional ArsR family regulator
MAGGKRTSGEKKGAAAATAATTTTATTSGAFAYEGLDRLIHERARLAILSSLATHERGLTFNDLKDLCALTDGNLSRQLQLLKEAGLVEIEKGTSGNRPQTISRLTRTGRKRFLEYVTELEKVVSNAAESARASSSPLDADDEHGLSPA